MQAQQGGAAKSKDAVRMARGPDGTRGFAPGRGRPLPPAPAAGSAPPPAAPGSVSAKPCVVHLSWESFYMHVVVSGSLGAGFQSQAGVGPS